MKDADTRIHTTFRSALLATLRTDMLARLAAGVFLAALPFYFFSILSPEQLSYVSARLHPLVLLVIAVTALRRNLNQVVHQDERRFWQDFSVAYGAWLVVAALYIVFPRLDKPLWVDLVVETLFAVYYVALILAVEREPHRQNRWRPLGLERALAWPSATIFVFGSVTYFVLIPLVANRQAYESNIPSMALYGALDGYLAIKLIYLALAAQPLRWRVLYGLLAGALGIHLVADVYEGWLYATAGSWGQTIDPLWNFPFVILVLAARVRQLRFPSWVEPVESARRLENHLPGPSTRTMVLALAFPTAHFAGYFFGILDDESKPARELVVLAALLLLGTVAVIQRWILDRKVQELWLDRKRIEDALLESEQDLRLMLARQEAEAAVSASEEKFTKAFRASPDAMGIATVAEGRYLEVNDGFFEVTGHRPEEVVGRSVHDLKLWTSPADRDAMVEELRRTGRVSNFEVDFRRKDGSRGVALYSAETIEIGGEPCHLFVARDITERTQAQEKIREQALLLDQAHDAICVLDLEDRISYWNKSAEELYGWTAKEAVGRPAAEVLYAGDRAAAREAHRAVASQGTWSGQLRQLTKDGEAFTVESRWTVVRDEAGRPRSRLVISYDVSRRKAGELVASP